MDKNQTATNNGDPLDLMMNVPRKRTICIDTGNGQKHDTDAELACQVPDDEVQEAIETIAHADYWLTIGTDHGELCVDVDKKLADAFALAIAALRQYRQPEPWIPVSERLPDADIGVLVWAGYQDIGWIDWKGGKWRREGEWFSDGQVTYWMPLPEPPLGGDRT